MVRSKSATTLKLSWTIILVCSVSTVLTNVHQKAKKGDDVILSCKGKKPLNWLNKDAIIGRQKGRIQQNVYGNLVFKSVRFSDSGIYTCSSADGNVVHRRIQLEVSGPPTLVNATRWVDAETNKDAVIKCLVEGHPDPDITWYIYQSGRKQEISERKTLTTRLPCKYCQVHFMCKAENKFGEEFVNITVNVVGKPEVTALEESVTGVIGQNVSVRCAVKSNPPISYIKWFKNGKLLKMSNRTKIDFKMDGYDILFTLTIERLREKDFDDYECLAVNKYGNETSKTIKISLKSRKSHRTSEKTPRVSPLSASTELVISSGEIPKQSTKYKNQDNKARKEEAPTQSSESVSSNMGSVCKNSWKQFTAMLILPFFMSTSFFLS